MVEIHIVKEEDFELITVNGEIDASSSIELDNVLKKASSETLKIMVDLQNLEYISSAGLGVFISYLEELKSKDSIFIRDIYLCVNCGNSMHWHWEIIK